MLTRHPTPDPSRDAQWIVDPKADTLIGRGAQYLNRTSRTPSVLAATADRSRKKWVFWMMLPVASPI